MRKIEKAPDWLQSNIFLRAINELSNNEEFGQVVRKINEQYLYWDKVKYQQNFGLQDHSVLWSAVKHTRNIPGQLISFGSYNFTYCFTNFIQKELHEFDLHIGGNLGTQGIIPDADKHRYLVSSIMEEAIASSQIEGAVTTRKKAKEMLRKSIRPKNKSEQMIVNNYETIRHIVEIQREPITREKLFEVHRSITHHTMDDPDDEGRYRDNNDVNVVDAIDGEIVHTPPDFREVPDLMDELLHFFNNNDPDNFIHPIVKGCIIHFMIGYIHPFVDGNGRTARSLFYWYLLKNGYWLTEYLSISRLIVKSKNQYAKAFIYNELDENDLTYFINYKMKVMKHAFDALQEYIQKKIREKKQSTDFQKIEGVNERQALILKWLVEEQDLLFNVKEIETRFNVSNQTARTDLTGLANLGYLDAIHLNKKTKGFSRSSAFSQLVGKVLNLNSR